MAAWNPFTLTFDDPQSEQDYIAESVEARVGLDLVGHCIGFILALIHLDGDTGLALIFKIIPANLLGPVLSYLCIRRRTTYIRWRNLALCFLEFIGLVYVCVKDSTLPPPAPETGEILSRLAKSPILPVLFSATSFPKRFRNQVLVNLSYGTLPVIFWSKQFCQLCADGEKEFIPVFEYLGSFIHRGVSILSMNGDGVFMPKHDCVSVVMFIEVLIAFLLPLYILYNSEVSSRAKFLSRNAGEADRVRILNLKKECQAWSVWVLMGSIVLAAMMF